MESDSSDRSDPSDAQHRPRPGALTRRDVLRGLGGLAVAGPALLGGRAAHAAGSHSLIPAVPNRPLLPGGVHGYAQKSLDAGATVEFRISSDVPYTLSVERLGWNVDGTDRDWVVHQFPSAPADPQPIRPGSYLHVDRALPSTTAFAELTLECWVRRFGGGAWQGLITQYDYPAQAGVGLFLTNLGQPAFYLGDGGAFVGGQLLVGPSAIPQQTWAHVCVTFSGGVGTLYVNGSVATSSSALPATIQPGGAPLRLGAYGAGGETTQFLDGDLAMPAIYERALSPGEIQTRASTTPPAPPGFGSGCVGCWPLDEEGGTTVRDVSGCDRTATVVNRGTWMVGGPGFVAANVPRFGIYDPDTDPNRGHAIRLSSSDLYDAGWPVSHSWTLPTDLPPGLYVGRIRHGSSGRGDVTLVVKRAASRPSAPLLVLCSTNTWIAYSAPFGLFSLYGNHAAGQPTYHVGGEVPWPAAAPYLPYITADYSHLVRAERHTHVWLEQNGYDFDVASDRDLHDDPALLSQYATVLILGHSEYWSRDAYEAVQAYMGSGGRLLVASGNTMFWRVDFDADGVMECRKLPELVGGRPNAQWGELYHESDHERGGLMRDADLPAWRLIGLECVGYSNSFTDYRVTNPTHPFFLSPEAVPVSDGSQIGGTEGVAHEWDVRLQNIPGSDNPMPTLDYTPVALAEGRASLNRLGYHADAWIGGTNPVLSEIIDWQNPTSGARLLNVGSIAAGRGLFAGDGMAGLFRNALHHFGVTYHLEAVSIAEDGTLRHDRDDGASWSRNAPAWSRMGGGFGDDPPTIVQWAPDRLAMMAVTPSGALRYRFWNGSTWSAWTTLGTGFRGRVAAVGWGRNRLQLLARGVDDVLYEYAWDGAAWSGWSALGGGLTSDPDATDWEGRRLSVAALGPAGQVLYRFYQNGSWSPVGGWTDMAGSFAHRPTLIAWYGNRLSVFAVDAAGGLHHKLWNGAFWTPSLTTWDHLGGNLFSPVAVAPVGGEAIAVFGIDLAGRLVLNQLTATPGGTSGAGWQDLGGELVGAPAVAAYRGEQLGVLATGANGRLQHLHWDGNAWSSWQDLGGAERESPALLAWTGLTLPAAAVPTAGLVATGALGAGLAAVGQRALRKQPSEINELTEAEDD